MELYIAIVFYYEKFTDGITICIDNEVPFRLPNSWRYCRLQSITVKDIKRGKSPKYAANSEVKVFAPKCNLKTGSINLESAQYLDKNVLIKYPENEYMIYGDTVVNSTGTGTLGKVTIIRTSEVIESKYIYFYLKSLQLYLEKSGEGSTNQKELKPDTLKQLLVPLPSLNEQKSILRKISVIYEKLFEIEANLS